MYDHVLYVTDVTYMGIDPPEKTSQLKTTTLSLVSPGLSFCIHVHVSLCIDLVKFFGGLAGT